MALRVHHLGAALSVPNLRGGNSDDPLNFGRKIDSRVNAHSHLESFYRHHNHPSTRNALHLRRCRFYVVLFPRLRVAKTVNLLMSRIRRPKWNCRDSALGFLRPQASAQFWTVDVLPVPQLKLRALAQLGKIVKNNI